MDNPVKDIAVFFAFARYRGVWKIIKNVSDGGQGMFIFYRGLGPDRPGTPLPTVPRLAGWVVRGSVMLLSMVILAALRTAKPLPSSTLFVIVSAMVTNANLCSRAGLFRCVLNAIR